MMIYIIILINIINSQEIEIESHNGGGGSGSNDIISTNGMYFSRPNFKQRYNRNNSIENINLTKFNIISCQNENDFSLLLYQICSLEHTCNELYYINEDDILNSIDFNNYDSIIRLYANKQFKKFTYQLLSINLFITSKIIKLNNTHYTETYNSPTFLNLWPLNWIPPYIIQFNNSQSSYCYKSIDITSIDSPYLKFIYTTIDSLKTYKQLVTNEHICNDANEKLILDSNYKFSCICKNGKSCNNENNFRKLLVFLMICILALVIIWIVTISITSISQLRTLSNINMRQFNNKKRF